MKLLYSQLYTCKDVSWEKNITPTDIFSSVLFQLELSHFIFVWIGKLLWPIQQLHLLI